MSIFKDTFKPGVQAQIKARQEAINERTPAAIQYFNARNSWIRMTSSVNVGEDAGALAKTYILLGGTLYDNKARTGVGTGNQAYSTLSPGGATNMLGIRPMPGITGINVKSLGAYGSLREVTVNFQCWDIRQLEELELLYMRPGYSVFVEWGWAPYLNNNKGLEGNISFIDDVLNGGKPKEEIWKNIFTKASTDGNYEGHYGFVKNYSWSARPDGGYDCTTNIISMGEILESLKINYGSYDVDTSKGVYNVLPISKLTKDSTIAKAYTQNKLAGIVAELYEIAKTETDKLKSVEGSTSIYPEVTFNGYTFFRFNVSVDGKDTKNTITTNGAQIYMPLKDFVSVLNDKILLNDSKNTIAGLSTYCGEHNGGTDVPLYCVGDELQISTDPSICLIKNIHWTNPVNLGLEDSINNTDFSTTKNIMLTLSQNYWKDGNYKTQQLGIIGNIYVNLDFIYSLITDPNLASQDKKEKNDIALFDFIKNLISRISTVLGNVSTFELFVDPQDSIGRIIDINYTGNRDDDWKKISEVPIQIQNTKSIVRSYKLESQIFQDQSTIIAIGAQAKGGALGEDVNTLINFNQNLTDRIVPVRVDLKQLNAAAAAAADEDKQKLQNLKDNFATLVNYIIKIDPGWFESKGNFDSTESSKYSNALKDIINYFRSIVKTDNKNRSPIPTKLSIDMDGIGGMIIGNLFKIPDEFLPRGYKGAGPGSPGPKKIAYAVTGLSHAVQNNDWTTTIESQFIIMDEPKGMSPSEARMVRAIVKAVTSTNDVGTLVNSTQATSGGSTKIICGQPRTNGNIEDLLVEINPRLYKIHYSSVNQSDNKRIRLQPEAMRNLEALLTDASNVGVYIKVNSAYRTYADQVRIKNSSSDIPCATPGTSNHGFGLAVDLANSSGGRINPITTPKEWKWIQENKDKYGFNNINITNESHHFNFTQIGKIC